MNNYSWIPEWLKQYPPISETWAGYAEHPEWFPEDWWSPSPLPSAQEWHRSPWSRQQQWYGAAERVPGLTPEDWESYVRRLWPSWGMPDYPRWSRWSPAAYNWMR